MPCSAAAGLPAEEFTEADYQMVSEDSAGTPETEETLPNGIEAESQIRLDAEAQDTEPFSVMEHMSSDGYEIRPVPADEDHQIGITLDNACGISIDIPAGAFDHAAFFFGKAVSWETLTAEQEQALSDRGIAEETVPALLDIGFLDADGEEIEPMLPVMLQITLTAVAESREDAVLEIYHVDESGGVPKAELVASSEAEQESAGTVVFQDGSAVATIEAGSFSIYAVNNGSSLRRLCVYSLDGDYTMMASLAVDPGKTECFLPAGYYAGHYVGGWSTSKNGSVVYQLAGTVKLTSTFNYIYVVWKNNPSGWGTVGSSSNVLWKIENGTLTLKPASGSVGWFSGEGYQENRWPWDSVRSSITSVKIQGTIHAYDSLGYAFSNCSNLRTIDLTGLDTSAVTSMENMFMNCGSLTSLTIPANFVKGSKITASYRYPYLPDQITHIQNSNGTYSAIVSGSTDLNSASVKTTYVPNPYVTISFYNGNSLLGTQSVLKGSTQNLSASYQGSVTGYSFYGWSTSFNSGTRNYTSGQSVTLSADLNLYAIYSRTITFYSGTAKSETNTVTQYYYGGVAQAVTAPTATAPNSSWTVYGWWTGTTASYSRNVAAGSSFYPGATVYYATFSRPVTVNYNANGGSGATAASVSTQYYNSYGAISSPGVSLRSNAFTAPAGKLYYQWGTSSTATSGYAAGSSYTIAPAVGTTSTSATLYAIWRGILTLPAQSGTLTYTGSAQSPLWNASYNSSGMTLGGTTSGTNAASYNATFTPKTGYCWSDGTEGVETVSWTIEKANPTYTAPSAKNLTYNGTTNTNGIAQDLLNAGSTSHGTIQYSSDSASWSTTVPAQINAGSYPLYWRLVGDDNHTDVPATSISAAIQRKGIARVTASATSLEYSGTKRIPVWNNYSADTTAINGTAAAQAVGSYSTSFTPKSNFQWSSGANATGVITLNWAVSNATYSVSYVKDGGTISDESSFTSYAYGTGLLLPTPTKQNYDFLGWYDNSDLAGTAITTISATDSGNKTYYAKWNLMGYAVTRSESTHGSYTVTVDGKTADIIPAGKTVSVDVSPDTENGYVAWVIHVRRDSDGAEIITASTDSGCIFAMPGEPVTVSVAFSKVFSVTVPAVLQVSISADGTVAVADHVFVVNNSSDAVIISAVSITPANGWILDSSFDPSKAPVDSRRFSLAVTTGSGDDLARQAIHARQSLPLCYTAAFAAQSTPMTDVEIAQVVFTVGWAT